MNKNLSVSLEETELSTISFSLNPEFRKVIETARGYAPLTNPSDTVKI
jgi:hypothetical protein